MTETRALLVCDESGLLEQIGETLSQIGYQVDRMIRGSGGMALLQRSSYGMVVVVHPISDVATSDLLSAVRHRDSLSRSASVVVLTVFDRTAENEALRQVGANQVLPLNTTADGLQATLKRLGEVAPRKACRIALRLRGESVASARQLFCQSENLSISGALLRGQMPWEVGDIVAFELGLPGQKPILGRAEVVRASVRSEANRSFAVTFREFEEDGEQRLRVFLDAIPDPVEEAAPDGDSKG